MALHLPHLAPARPAVHLATPSGWLNDPNGLCFHAGTWHAFYQHDPDTDVHRTMHWGHATSSDLLRWTHHPIALHPDELGDVFSGSIVIDADDTAGFGAGAMVAIFTHHLDPPDGLHQLERQSLACSLDSGLTWTKFEGNPVLESDRPDFRDPKVFRHEAADDPAWIMAVAAGHRVEFYRSGDLRSWELTGSYEADLPGLGTWECPDLVPLRTERGVTWALLFGAVGVGPHGHSGTYVVLGDFDGRAFRPDGLPERLDHGPDFYAAQTFHGAPDGRVIAMAWLNSWLYSRTHPSRGWRGILSLPRELGLTTAGGRPVVRSRPAGEFRTATRLDTSAWTSEPGRALRVHLAGPGDVEVAGRDGEPVATVSIDGDSVRLVRHQDVTTNYAETYEAPLRSGGDHEIVIDHGTIEVFAAGGTATISALAFPGEQFAVRVEGPAALDVV